jgi:cytoskeletal protein RodZ
LRHILRRTVAASRRTDGGILHIRNLLAARGLRSCLSHNHEEKIMNLQSSALVAAIAAMSWAFAPVALSQEPEEALPPSSSAEQSQSATDDLESPSAKDLDEEATAAQETTPSESADAGALDDKIDDKKIEQFADAYVEVQTIQKQASADLAAAQDTAAADSVKTKAESDMIAAVERSGLQVDEFNQIVETMASNVEVRNKVAAKLQQRSGG